MTSVGTPDLLATIVAATRRGVEFREGQRPVSQLQRETAQEPRGEAFAAALRNSLSPRVIAECKRRSPSRGILRADYHPAAHARAYESAGAAAISVLTEPTFFDGSPDHLRAVRSAVSIPVLRKDFIVTDYQIHEAAWLGADAILLIVAALEQRDLQRLLALASQLGLAAMVEVHDEQELTRAKDAGAKIIGVNSRNLRTLTVDSEVLERLSANFRLKAEATLFIAESGIKTFADIERLSTLGYSAFLVGERLIAQPDPGAALRELRGV